MHLTRFDANIDVAAWSELADFVDPLVDTRFVLFEAASFDLSVWVPGRKGVFFIGPINTDNNGLGNGCGDRFLGGLCVGIGASLWHVVNP